MTRRGALGLFLGCAAVVVAASPGRSAPAPPAARAVVALMLAGPSLVDYEGTKVITAVRGPRAETVTVLESYRRSGKVRLEFLSPESVSGRLVVDDGASSWQYEPSLHLVIRGPSFAGRLTGPDPAEVMRRYFIVVLGVDEVIGRRTAVIAIEPRSGGASRRYWIDLVTGVTLRLEERDAGGEIAFTSFFTRISYGLNLPSALFRPALPAGARLLSFYLSGDPVRTPEELQRVAKFGLMMPDALPFGYRFREGMVSRHGAVPAAAAVYTDGIRALSVFQTPSSRMAFPQAGAPVALSGADGRSLDLGYFRVLLWRARGVNVAAVGSLPAAALVLIAEELLNPIR
jgi:outer membrane lipoprotein-sorting protein